MKKTRSSSWSLLTALVICVFLSLPTGAAGKQTTRPKLRVAADGLPSGHDTPEGAACDLARSFINRDEKLFLTTSIRLYGGGSGRDAYAKFLHIMFVDVGVYLQNGERAMNRTLVIKDKDGKWYVDPDPSVSPLLSDGLNEEKASVKDLTDVYELEGQNS